MGLLDDAIREHLDLKRRRGADPAEVERAEQEALGPVRRAPHGSEEPHLEFVSDEDHGYEPEYTADEVPVGHDDEVHEELDWHDPLEDGADRPDPGTEFEPQPPPPAAAAPPPAVTPPPAAATPAPAAAPPPATERPAQPPASAEPNDAEAGPPVYDDEETVEYDVEEALGAAEERDDPLEETPEFLQDTPDHDRLWFEQKPPRDFDFDD
jgi:hypothetical protein